MVSGDKHEGNRHPPQDGDRVLKAEAACREIAGANNDISFATLSHDGIGHRRIPMQVAERKDLHLNFPDGVATYFEKRNIRAPSIVSIADTSFTRLRRSFRKKTPINSANTMLVSLRAVTTAMGACVKAHTTSA